MNISIFIPVIVVVITASMGILTYLFQKRTDRRNELIKLRQLEYRKYLDAFQTTINENSKESLGDYHKTLLNLFVVASDQVISAVGNLNKYMAETSPGSVKERDILKVGELLAISLKAMRKDCFEKSELMDKDVRNILPYQGMTESTLQGLDEVGKNFKLKSINLSFSKSDDPLRENNMENDAGILAIENQINEAKKSILHNYKELVRIGNPPGANTAQTAFIVYLASSLSTLTADQLNVLKSQGILNI